MSHFFADSKVKFQIPNSKLQAAFLCVLCALCARAAFAEVPASMPAPSEIGLWLYVAGFVGNIVLAVVTLVDRNKTQRRHVSIETEFARKEETREEMDKIWNQMEDNRNHHDKKQSDQIIAVHERINQILAAVSELKGRTAK